MSSSIDTGRRRFLIHSAAVVGAAGASRVFPGCGGMPSGGDSGPSPTELTVADVPVGTHVQPSGASFIVARDANGLFAYSNVCTHEGCPIPVPATDGTSTCPCHHARFDAQGDNLVGPNGRGTLAPLPHFAVTLEGSGPDARIVVDTGTRQLDRTARTPVSDAAADAATG
jgi:Rieske Fe-S protein